MLEPRDPTGYARRNARVLLALFAAFVLFGLLAGNAAALIGGALGIGWVGWENRDRLRAMVGGGRGEGDGDGNGGGNGD